jgi:hypothetical protein
MKEKRPMTDRYLTLTSVEDDTKVLVSMRAVAYIRPSIPGDGGSTVYFSGLEDDFLTVKETLDQIQALL